MTKAELLKNLVASEDLQAAVVDIIAYVKGVKGTLDSNLEGVKTKVETLIGSDTGKSARTIANEELAKQLIPSNAKDALDTLEEIAAWIQQHPDDAAAMNKSIDDLKTLVGTLPADTTATTVVGYITAEIAAVKAAIEGKNVTAEGETGDDALFTLTAANNKVTGASTTKLQNAVGKAESAVQPEDIETIGVTAAKKIVADAIAASESSSEE